MTYSAFMYSLRFLVLCGLCFTNFANAAAVCVAGSNSATFSSPSAACAAYPAYLGASRSVLLSNEQCRIFTTNPDGSESSGDLISVGCSCATAPVDRVQTIQHNGLSQPDFRWTNWNPQPNTCTDNCLESFDPVATRNRVTVGAGQPPIYTGSDPSRQEFVCNTIPAGSNGSYCTAVWNPSGLTCFTPPSPPAPCPTGTVRAVAGGACKPITCTAPLVKVGNQCEIPSCPSGQTYEYKDGAGACVANPPLCTPPQTNVNGVCKTPECPSGMVMSPSGVCTRDPVAGNPPPSTPPVTNPGTPPVSPPAPTPPVTPPVDNPDQPKPPSAPPTGSPTNNGGSGLCTTPPCGNCDPTKETCGNTFGGSCKSNFQCNGDAIQCAVALATNKAECLLKSLYVDEETNSTYIEGKAIVDGGTKALGEVGGIQVATGGAISINRLNPFSSSCPSDIPLFDYKGQNYALPIAQYCNIWQAMGAIMLVIAGLISVRILMKVD